MTEHEFERIARIRKRLSGAGGGDGEGVVVGIGDDAAVLAPSESSQIVTVDVAVEGVHFRREWGSWRVLARRAVVCAASDVAAMGGRGRCALVALVLPAGFADAALDEIADGIADAARECKAPVVGGNLSSGTELSITTTVIGEVDGAPMRRSGARPGDGIYVTGPVGAAGLGLAILARGGPVDEEPHRYFVERWRRPIARLVEGMRLRNTATACIDVSDGLLADLGHLCEQSSVGARLYASELPLARGFRELARTFDLDPIELALGSGDDYQLLFTAPATPVAKQLATRIGEVRPADDGVVALGEHGEPLTVSHAGWQHR